MQHCQSQSLSVKPLVVAGLAGSDIGTHRCDEARPVLCHVSVERIWKLRDEVNFISPVGCTAFLHQQAAPSRRFEQRGCVVGPRVLPLWDVVGLRHASESLIVVAHRPSHKSAVPRKFVSLHLEWIPKPSGSCCQVIRSSKGNWEVFVHPPAHASAHADVPFKEVGCLLLPHPIHLGCRGIGESIAVSAVTMKRGGVVPPLGSLVVGPVLGSAGRSAPACREIFV